MPSGNFAPSFFVSSFVAFSSPKYFLQASRLQYQYSLFPVLTQVASLASICFKSCAALSTVSSLVISCVAFSSLKYFLQESQYQYSIFPSSVQVGAFSSVFLRFWCWQAGGSAGASFGFWKVKVNVAVTLLIVLTEAVTLAISFPAFEKSVAALSGSFQS